MSNYARVAYTGAAPTGANTVNLFSTVTAFPGGNMLAGSGVHKLRLNMINSQAGTLKGYRSVDRGVNWTQVTSDAVTAPSAGTSNDYDFLIEPFMDYKLDWTNGGVDQATWVIDMALIDERGAP